MAGDSSSPAVSIIVPCLNEEQNLSTLVDRLDSLLAFYELSAEILIVDDCSDDYTFREALRLEDQRPSVRALHKGLPRGLGNAVRFGIGEARGQVGIVVMGDLVDPLDAIPDMVR